jgi:L-ascorbate metabolism protein UlaG (beta-lactamase superfamily)
MQRRNFLRLISLSAIGLLYRNPIISEEISTNRPAHHTDSGFRNIDPNAHDANFFAMLPWILGKIGDVFSPDDDFLIPRIENDAKIFGQNLPYTVTWIGQSTALIQIEGKNILTDPVWSDIVGPLSWLGSKRISEPGLKISQLPPIDIILISHNHFDHLDEPTIMEFAKDRNIKFFVPLKVKKWFDNKGIKNVEEYDWWEEILYKDLKIVCTPGQHFSSRGLGDRDHTLWSGWAVFGKSKRFYFAGDTGYCHHFKEIGNKFDYFDLTIIPIGAYDPRRFMKFVHLNPMEALEVHLNVCGKMMLPIHWGTFKLSDEPVNEPTKMLVDYAKSKQINENHIFPFLLGETRIW